MVTLIEEGKVRAAGVSNFDVPLLDRCEAIGHVDSLQPPLSLLINRSGAEHKRPAVVREPRHGRPQLQPDASPACFTARFAADRVASLATDDWRRRAPEFQQPNLGRNLALRDALRPIATRIHEH